MSVQMDVLVDLCTHSSGEESAGQRSPAEDADLVDEDGRREDRHEETERQEKICRAGVMSIEPLGGLFEIREDAGMQMEEVDGECGSSHLVYPLAGEVQPRCGGQDEQGAEDDVRGTVKDASAVPCIEEASAPCESRNEARQSRQRNEHSGDEVLQACPQLERTGTVKSHIACQQIQPGERDGRITATEHS